MNLVKDDSVNPSPYLKLRQVAPGSHFCNSAANDALETLDIKYTNGVPKDDHLTDLRLPNSGNLLSLTLRCSQLLDIDLSHSLNLEEVDLQLPNIPAPTITMLKQLKSLKLFSGTEHTPLDLSQHNALQTLNLQFGYKNVLLPSISRLESLTVNDRKITSIDLSTSEKLSSIDLSHSGIESIDVSNNKALKQLNISG